jgi:hypothetical protein
MLETQLPMGGLTWLVLISTVYSTISSTLSCFSTSSSQPSLTWRRLWKRTGVSRHLSDTFDLPLRCLYTCRFNGVPGLCAGAKRDWCGRRATMLLAQQGILARLWGFARGWRF